MKTKNKIDAVAAQVRDLAASAGLTPQEFAEAMNRYEPPARLVELRAALIAAVKVIKSWHGMGALDVGSPFSITRLHEREKMLDEVWRIYWRKAPEMAAIRAALPGVDLDEVERL